jgi:hypothetical protein
MNYSREICKVTDNQIVFPITDTENIGDSLSSINYNFNALDVYTCNFEYSASNLWNDMYNLVSTNSADWIDTINIVNSNSACWQDTYNTVKNLSAIWLKPISLIYPYPFSVEGSAENIINDVTAWVNASLPVNTETCVNFIVGQELFIFTPQYSQINKIFSQEKNLGIKTVQVSYSVNCIGAGNRGGVKNVNVDCGNQRLDISVTDKFISIITGLKFVVDSTGSYWIYDSALYNND